MLALGAAFAIDPPRNRAGTVVAAASGFSVLLVIALAAAAALGRFSGVTAWFGLIPVAVGAMRLWRLYVVRRPDDVNWISSGPSILAIVLATGGDNVAVYAPLFARSPLSLAWSAVYLLLWTASCAVLVRATPDLRRVRALQRYAEPTVATAFVALGLYIVIGR